MTETKMAEQKKQIEPGLSGAALSVIRGANLLQEGKVLAFPTETVYGLGADADNEDAVRQVFALKGRPPSHPLIVHLAAAPDLFAWGKVTRSAEALAAAFWPGPLTLILAKAPAVKACVTGGQDSIGLRVPAHPVAQALLGAFGGGVAAPSANRFGRISPTCAAHVRDEFGGRVPVLDGGVCEWGLESTIVDARQEDAVRVLRPGAVTVAALQEVLGKDRVVYDQVARAAEAAEAALPRVSGSLERHYAPQTPALIVEDAQSVATAEDAVLSYLSAQGAAKLWRTLPAEPVAYARELYAALRQLDSVGAKRILVETVPEDVAWWAVRDRLRRAAAPQAGRGRLERHSRNP